MSNRPDRLAEALRALLPRFGDLRQHDPRPPGSDHAARLHHLERDLQDVRQDVRTRVNVLFFTVIAVALGDLVGRLVMS